MKELPGNLPKFRKAPAERVHRIRPWRYGRWNVFRGKALTFWERVAAFFTPQYRLTEQTYLGDRLLDPYKIGMDRKSYRPRYAWWGIPNHAMEAANVLARVRMFFWKMTKNGHKPKLDLRHMPLKSRPMNPDARAQVHKLYDK